MGSLRLQLLLITVNHADQGRLVFSELQGWPGIEHRDCLASTVVQAQYVSMPVFSKLTAVSTNVLLSVRRTCMYADGPPVHSSTAYVHICMCVHTRTRTRTCTCTCIAQVLSEQTRSCRAFLDSTVFLERCKLDSIISHSAAWTSSSNFPCWCTVRHCAKSDDVASPPA